MVMAMSWNAARMKTSPNLILVFKLRRAAQNWQSTSFWL
jgi:hypothetical protein